MPILRFTGGQLLRAVKGSGDTRVSNQPGVFCVSVDTQIDESDSAAPAQRRQDFLQLLQRSQLPSNWTMASAPKRALPANFEVTVSIPKQTSRGELVKQLRQINAGLSRSGQHVESVVLDPHEARTHWDVLVRQGCHIARPRTATASADITPRVLRGGLWYAPLSCSFVGGSRRSVRSLFSVCQRRLVESANRGGLFHLNVDVGNSRSSWKEELDALKALLQTAADLKAKQRLHCVPLSGVPNCILRKSPKPMHSVLRRAA